MSKQEMPFSYCSDTALVLSVFFHNFIAEEWNLRSLKLQVTGNNCS